MELGLDDASRPLIGRDAEQVRVDELCRPGAVVTVTGPGGVGKTRLVVELASRRGAAGEPVTVGLLAPLAAGSGPEAVVAALGFESVDAGSVVLAERHGLVVLDGCEHVLGAVRDVVASLRSPTVAVVVTSRVPLGVAAERVVALGPLRLSAPGDADPRQVPAVALFLERAAEAGADVGEGAVDLGDVAELCRRLDGLPLAIELAAARARAIGPADMLRTVDRRLDLLRRHGPGDGRHDSMRAAIEMSTSLLDPSEHTLFRRLGVFTGPFDVDLAHAVAGEPGTSTGGSLDILARLVEQSLVVAERRASMTRYHLLELLREHAREELATAGETASVEERFVDGMVAVADDVVARVSGTWEPTLLGAASSQFANLARACELCLERDGGPDRAYRLMLPMFATVHEGRAEEVRQLGRRVRDRWDDAEAPARAEALAVLATAAATAGHLGDVDAVAEAVVGDDRASDLAVAIAERARGLAARPRGAGVAARHFGSARAAAERAGLLSLAREVEAFEAGETDAAGDAAGALQVLDDLVRRGREADDAFSVVLALLVRARVRLRAGAADGAGDDVEAAEAIARTMDPPWWTAATLRTAAAVASFGPGGWAAAAPRWREAVDAAARRGAVGEVAITLRAAAAVAWKLGDRSLAAELADAVPRSAAVTVMPDLFPEVVAEMGAAASGPPVSVPVVVALARARAALGGALGGADGSVDETVGGGGDDDRGAAAALVAEGDSWRLDYAGRSTRMRHMKGIGDLAVLLARPGTEVHALELMGGHDVGGAAGPAIDERARRAYQDRIIELQRDIDEAAAANDPARAERAEVELDALVEQLSQAFGLGGRTRTGGSTSERARSAVTYRIRSAIGKVGEAHPELGRHLTNAVRTGTWCSYRPERTVRWTIDASGLTM